MIRNDPRVYDNSYMYKRNDPGVYAMVTCINVMIRVCM